MCTNKWVHFIMYKLYLDKFDLKAQEQPFLSVAQLVNNPPAVWETWVRSLGWEDPLEKGMAIHSSILAWRMGSQSRT